MKKVKEGYKKTELGEIPEEWEVKSISDICEVNPKKEILEDETEVSFIAMEDVSNEGRIIRRNVRKYGEVKKGYTAFKEDDVLIAKITPCFENGKKAIASHLINKIGFGSTEFHVLRPSNNHTNPLYIYYTISTNRFMQQAQANMTGSAGQKRVPTEFLKGYTIPIPSIKEQQKIASILSSVDEQIEITDNFIEKTKELKKGLMQRLLTKGIGHGKFKDTEIGRIPEEWKIRKLEDCIYTQTGHPFNSKFFNVDEIGVPLIRIRDLLLSNISTYYSGDYDDEYLVNYNDILIGMDGEFNIVKWRNNKGLLNQRICRIKSKDCDLIYIYYYLKDVLKQIEIETPSTTVKHLVIKDMLNRKIAFPKLKEQQKIASILSSVDNQIQEYESKKAKLENLKKGLMQKLLTGKIRVKI